MGADLPKFGGELGKCGTPIQRTLCLQKPFFHIERFRTARFLFVAFLFYSSSMESRFFWSPLDMFTLSDEERQACRGQQTPW